MKMRWLVVVMVVLLTISIGSMVRCTGNDGQETAEVVATEEDTEGEEYEAEDEEYEAEDEEEDEEETWVDAAVNTVTERLVYLLIDIDYQKVPPFVSQMLPGAEWTIDTLCSVRGKNYYRATDMYGRRDFIYDDEKVIVDAPALYTVIADTTTDTKYNVYFMDRCVPIDFRSQADVARLSRMNDVLPHFTRFSRDTIPDIGNMILFSLVADFPDASVSNSKAVSDWTGQTVLELMSQECTTTYPYKAMKRAHRTGRGFDKEGFYNAVSRAFFGIASDMFGPFDEYYPSTIFFDVSLQARVCNDRFVTYQSYTHRYMGEMHGYYTEKLLSYDLNNQEEIDCEYLFRPECMGRIVPLIVEEAEKDANYRHWEADVAQFVTDRDDEGNPTGGYTLPRPGLAERGMVFSFQPYEISCFAAGTFHFTVPYHKLKPYLTEKGLKLLYPSSV